MLKNGDVLWKTAFVIILYDICKYRNKSFILTEIELCERNDTTLKDFF